MATPGKKNVSAGNSRPDPRSWPDHGAFAAWLGHSTVLLKLDGYTVITDPVLGAKVGVDLRIAQVGIRRLVDPALAVHDLPHIDLVLLSHAHFDHFDKPTLRALRHPKTEVITAPHTASLLRFYRYRRIRELRWGEEVSAGPLRIKALEVQHWGARYRTDTYRGYNGYLVHDGSHRVLFGGDTAMTDAFRHVRSSQRIDLAIMPIGAYQPWIRNHCTPEQALRMGLDAGADQFLPVHHQTFRLGREPLLEPIERFQLAAARDRVPVLVHQIGQQTRVR